MKYAKPEINALGDAASVIQGLSKPAPQILDPSSPPPKPRNFTPAYDLDE